MKGVPLTYIYHEFKKNIGYATLNPDKEWPRREKNPEFLSGNKRNCCVHHSPVSTPNKARTPNLKCEFPITKKKGD